MADTVHFKRIDARTVLPICRLSETLTPEQRKHVTDNSISITQAHFSQNAWFRAIYAFRGLCIRAASSRYGGSFKTPCWRASGLLSVWMKTSSTR